MHAHLIYNCYSYDYYCYYFQLFLSPKNRSAPVGTRELGCHEMDTAFSLRSLRVGTACFLEHAEDAAQNSAGAFALWLVTSYYTVRGFALGFRV